MTNEDINICIMLIFLSWLLVWILVRITAQPSHSGATEPSTLPPQPKPQPSGPWFLHVVFLDPAECPDLWYRADDLRSIVGEPKTHRLVIYDGTGEVVFRNVEQYNFEQLSQMGDWLMTEE